MTLAVDALVEKGRLALSDGDGPAARRAFQEALEAAPDSDAAEGSALEGLGHAAYLMLDLDEALTQWQRCFARYRESGNRAAAARAARNVAYLYGSYIGDWAIAGGWLARAQDFVAGEPDSPERGWVWLTSGMFEGNRERKDRFYLQAIEASHETHDAELRFTTLSYYGASLVHGGRTEEGMMRLDEALAAVAGGDVDDPVLIEEIFCQLFSACEYAHDLTRAEQWMRIGDELARRRSLTSVAAFCTTHYGGLLTAAGRWPEADEALTEAVRLWALGRRKLKAGALARLAELRVRQGRLADATYLLDGLDLTAESARPLAALRLAEGRTAEAREVLERSLAVVDPASSEAGGFLALLVDCHLALGDAAEAELAVAALAECGGDRPGTYLTAVTALARGRVALATGDSGARAQLREALDGFTRAHFPLETARTRLELAIACVEDRPEVALAEARAAYDAFEALRAARHVDAAAALLRTLGVKMGSAQSDGGRLTRRESEVLDLVGQGLSNPDIAARLFISRKTVEHHLGNVFDKLGIHSRSEAAAYSVRQKQGSV